MKALALVAVLAPAVASGTALADPGEEHGLFAWSRAGFEQQFAQDGRVEPPSTASALDRVERRLAALARPFVENERRFVALHDRISAVPERHSFEHRTIWNRKSVPFFRRHDALKHTLDPAADELSRIVRDLTFESPSAPRAFRLAAQITQIGYGLYAKSVGLLVADCPNCSIGSMSDPSEPIEDQIIIHASDCWRTAADRQDVVELERCEVILHTFKPNEWPLQSEVYPREFLWQPTLVAAR